MDHSVMNKIINEFIKEILTELSFRKKDGIPDLKSEKDLDILHSILIEMGYSEISDELIKNIVEGGGGEPKEDEPPIDIDKDKIEFVGKDAEDLQAKIDYAGLTDAGFGFYSNADGKVIYKKDDSGLKLIPATQEELDDINRKIQKDKSVFNSPEGQEYLKDLPDTDPLKQKQKNESIDNFINTIVNIILTEDENENPIYKKHIKNPETGRDVMVKTAISDKDHPAYNKAKNLLDKETSTDDESSNNNLKKQKKDILNNLKNRKTEDGDSLDIELTKNGSLIIGVEHGEGKKSNQQIIDNIKKLPKDTKVMFVAEGGMTKDDDNNLELAGEQSEIRDEVMNHFDNAEESSWDENANVFDNSSPVFDVIANDLGGSKPKANAAIWSMMVGQGDDLDPDDYLDDEGKNWLINQAKDGGSKQFDGDVDWANLTDEQRNDIYELNFRDDDSYGETEIYKAQESYNNFRQKELDIKLKEAEDNGYTVIAPVGNSHVDMWRKRNKSINKNESINNIVQSFPLKKKSVDEILENILDSYLTEASYLDDKYKIGHQIIFNKETPPKWAPNLKTGDILTIVPDDTNVTTYGTGEFVKTLQLPNGEKVRVADKNRDGGDSKLFMHLKKGEVEPSGEDWEALIVCAYNGIDESSPEWKRAKIYWAKHEEDAKKIANSFSKILKSKKIKQLGSSTAQKNPDWLGKDPTPKTDILGDANEKISLKKEGGSQLMSAGKEETISTFNAAMKMVGENKPKIIEQFLDKLETKMGKMSEAGTISALEKLKNSGEKLTLDQQKKIAEMDQLQLNAKEINKDINTIFEDIYFKSCFCFEAATGTNKFADKNAVANKLIEFNPSGNISANLTINNIEDAKVLALKNSFYVSFKTGSASSKPYLSMRTKQIKLKNITFKDIVYEEFYKNNIGRKIIKEVNKKQLNEFEIFNKLIKGIKNVSSTVRDQVKNILKNIINRVKEVIDHIKTLGSKMFNAILYFLGMKVDDVNIKTSGPFPLI